MKSKNKCTPSKEFKKFEELARKLVSVPKKDIVGRHKAVKKMKEPKVS